MTSLTTILVIVGAVLLIGAGLVGLIHDLLGRGPHEAPLIEDDSLRRPQRHQASGSQCDVVSGELEVDLERCDGMRH